METEPKYGGFWKDDSRTYFRNYMKIYVKQYNSVLIECTCGRSHAITARKRHLKTAHHKKYSN